MILVGLWNIYVLAALHEELCMMNDLNLFFRILVYDIVSCLYLGATSHGGVTVLLSRVTNVINLNNNLISLNIHSDMWYGFFGDVGTLKDL